MMEAPAADRTLRPEDVRRVVREQFPELAADSVRHLGSGFEHDAYLVDEAVVFRFPRYAAVAEGLDYDRLVHELARTGAGGSFQVPEITFQGQPGPVFPHRFVGHAVVQGIGLDDPGVRRSASRAPGTDPGTDFGTDLGIALTRVHSIPLDEAAAVGVPRSRPDCLASLAALRSQLPHVPALADAAPHAHGWARSVPGAPDDADVPARLIHNGLHEEHIIVDPATGRLSGIIDWSSAAVGDPAVDFAFVLAVAGPDIYRAAMEAYELEVDEEFHGRVIFRARVRTVGWLAYAVHQGLDTRRRLEQIGSAFSLDGSF